MAEPTYRELRGQLEMHLEAAAVQRAEGRQSLAIAHYIAAASHLRDLIRFLQEEPEHDEHTR